MNNKHINYSAMPSEFGRWRTVALGIGGLGSIIILGIALLVPEMREQALRSWLLGFIMWCGISVGSLGLLILQYLTGGAWGVVSRRIFEAASGSAHGQHGAQAAHLWTRGQRRKGPAALSGDLDDDVAEGIDVEVGAIAARRRDQHRDPGRVLGFE